nr:hypothetical protein X990_5526 [Burkholderia pseudomallei MSHR4868]
MLRAASHRVVSCRIVSRHVRPCRAIASKLLSSAAFLGSKTVHALIR